MTELQAFNEWREKQYSQNSFLLDVDTVLFRAWTAGALCERGQCAKICDSVVADIGEYLSAKLEYMRGCREEALRLGNNIRDRK